MIWRIVALTMTMQGEAPAAGIPAPPPPHRYVVDQAGVLDSAELHIVDSIARNRAAAKMPIFLLTIRSLDEADDSDISFEEFSRRTFRAWRAGRPGADRAAMLVVSVDDRMARIEAAPGWGREHDAALRTVMADAIEPAMSRSTLHIGIVLALREMTWALEPPAVSTRLRDALIGLGVVLAGGAAFGALRRRRATAAPRQAAPTPRPMAAIDPDLRVSQRMRAIGEARKHSEKAASTIAWLDTGEMPKFDPERPPEAGKQDDEDEK